MNDELISASSNQSGFTSFLYIIPIGIIFGIVYACSLSFVYIEGDDASSVLFHALGRNVSLQPPYSPYHGMMDIFLGILPANEIIVRYTSIGISALAAASIVVLIIKLIQEWLPGLNNSKLTVLIVFILLCSPEIFYLGMVYTPSLIAMSLVLAAHLLIRFAYKRFLTPVIVIKYFVSLFFLSAIIFGVGVACRWDIGTYLIFIVADLTLNAGNNKPLKQVLKFNLAWGVLAFIASLIAIFGSGYGMSDIQFALNLAKSEILSSDSWFATLGAYQTIFTPALAIFFLTGWLFLAYTQKRLAVLVVLGLISVAPYLFSREPKMILPAFAAIWLAVAAGINLIWFSNTRFKYLTFARVSTIILMVLPWLVGLQVNSEETSWGPGFDIKTFVPASAEGNTPDIVTNQVEDRAVSISDFNLSLEGGFAIPTPEGPRPLGGHANVLLNGEWRDLALKLDTERKSVVEQALSTDLNILQDEGNSIFIAKLVEMNFLTNDKKASYALNGINERKFFNPEGEFVKLQVLKVRKSLFDKVQILELIKLNPNRKVILLSGYSSTIRKLFDTAPESVSPLGPFSAIVDLDALVKTLD